MNDTTDRELKLSRWLHAPIELVWQVWTDPNHIKNWWGPDGFSNTIHEMDVQEGGEWNLTMHGPDGTDYKNKSVFVEVVLHQKIVYEHLSNPKFRSTITFDPKGDLTHIEWHMLFESKEQFENVVKTFKADQGLAQNIEKLNRYLEAQTTFSTKLNINNMEKIIVQKTYNAPISLVWNAITNKDAMRKWYFDFAEDWKLEVGQVFEWSAGDLDDKQWLHRGKMLEIIDGQKLVYSWEYPGYVGYSIVSWELEALEEDRTKLTLTHVFTIPFDHNQPALKRENFVGGWDHIVNISLAEFLETKN